MIIETFNYFLAGVLVGYACFWFLLSYIPKRMLASEKIRCQEVIDGSRKQVEIIKEEQKRRIGEKFDHLRAEMQESIQGKQEDLKIISEDLEVQAEQSREEEKRFLALEEKLRRSKDKSMTSQNKTKNLKQSLVEIYQQLNRKLESRCDESFEEFYQQELMRTVDSRNLEFQKILKAQVSDYNAGAKRIARRFLARTHSRYSPEFTWPRHLNSVAVKDQRKFDILENDEAILQNLMELTDGVQIKLVSDKSNNSIKLAGGFGIAREAARLALNNVLAKHTSMLGRIKQPYTSHLTNLEQEAARLGKKACIQLKLEGVHPEIQKLVGYLNWRTSYKQNQWYHSVEVATLAGILAHELGVDPSLARRCGLLHDIGKAIDYRIEGSHAVISGDYADRFGEERVVCDAVMSHHNDLVVETPLAYVLKSSDTLSGARPGARVNLSEDYQSRLSAIENVILSFSGVTKVIPMHGAREVHVEVDQKKVKEAQLEELTKSIAQKLSEEVTFPGQIKVMVSRKYEVTLVA